MKRTLGFKIIALLLAAVMLCPAAALAELKGAFGAKQGEPVGLNSLGAAVREGKEPELTELDLALNAEGSTLHFETTSGDWVPMVLNESEEIIQQYGQRVVGRYVAGTGLSDENGNMYASIQTTVTVNAGDSIVYDRYCYNYGLNLYVDGIETGVSYSGRISQGRILTEYYTFSESGTHVVEWRGWSIYFIDDVRIESSIINEELSSALNVVGGNLPFVTLGRVNWEVTDLGDGEHSTAVTISNDNGNAQLLDGTYDAMLAFEVFLRAGEQISFFSSFEYASEEPSQYTGQTEYAWLYRNSDVLHIFESDDLAYGPSTGVITDTAVNDGVYRYTIVVKNLMVAYTQVFAIDDVTALSSEDHGEISDYTYLNAALNAENAEYPLEFYCPSVAPGEEYTQTLFDALPFMACAVDGRYTACNLAMGLPYYTDLEMEYPACVATDTYMSAGSQLKFDFKISCEEYDRFCLYVNGAKWEDFSVAQGYGGWSGSYDWQTYVFTAPADGNYSFRWQYTEDSTGRQGFNHVWLDNVELVGVVMPELSALAQAMNASGCTLDYTNDSAYPWVAAQYDGVPVGRSNHTDIHDDMASSYITATVNMAAGDTLSFDYLVSSEEECDGFCFYANDELMFFESGILDWQSYAYTAESSGSYTFKWEYMRDDGDWEGDDCVYIKNVNISGGAAIELSALAQAMNASGCTLDYTNDSAYPWVAAQYDGVPVGRSNHTDIHDDMASSYITATVNMAAGDTLSFDYLVSSEEECDGFCFYANDELMFFESGILDWQSYAYTAETSGNYTFKWEYMRDDGDWEGDDCVYVKNVSFSGDSAGDGEKVYDAELSNAVCRDDFPVLMSTDSSAPWTACEGYAEAGEGATAVMETEIYIPGYSYITYYVCFDTEEDESLKVWIERPDGSSNQLIHEYSGLCDEWTWNGDFWAPPGPVRINAGNWILRFEFTRSANSHGTYARVRDLCIYQGGMYDEPSTEQELNEALNAEGGTLEFHTYGTHPFVAETDPDDEQRRYARSTCAVFDSCESVIYSDIYMTADQALCFDYKAACGRMPTNDWDYAVLYIDGCGTRKTEWFSTQSVYRRASFTVDTEGWYRFTWAFYKDNLNQTQAYDFESDYTFWLDNVELVDVGAVKSYDGKLHGNLVSNSCWYEYDLQSDNVKYESASPNGFFLVTAAYCPLDGKLYGYTAVSDSSGTLYRGAVVFNPSTHMLASQTFSPVESINYLINGLTYSVSDDTLYGVSTNGTLYMVSRDADMTPTELGQLKQGSAMGVKFLNLASDNEGNLYSVGDNGKLYLIDKNTITAAPVGDTGLVNENGYFCSLLYENVTEKLYMSYADENGGDIYEIDLDTAEATVVMADVGQVTCLFTYTPADIMPAAVLGDANCDGVVTFADVAALYSHVLGTDELTARGVLNADMNGDGELTFLDVAALYQYIIGLGE